MTYDEEYNFLRANVGSLFRRNSTFKYSSLFSDKPNFLFIEVEKIKNPSYELGALDSTLLFVCKFMFTNKESSIIQHNELISGKSHFEKLYVKVV